MFKIENKLVLQLSRSDKFKFELETFGHSVTTENFNWKYFSERCADTMLSPVVFSCLKKHRELLSFIPAEYVHYFSQVQNQIIIKTHFLSVVSIR